jgi:very-short-patch-repair endonuclease
MECPRGISLSARAPPPPLRGGPPPPVGEDLRVITGPIDTIKRARKLRREMTLPERKLWAELRKRPGGFKFRKQHGAGIYVLDFYCAETRLAIEVDGFAHDGERAAARDARRSAWLRSQGVATTRIPARLILEDVEPVLVRIAEICGERVEALAIQRASFQWPVPLHHPADGPPPPVGEE